MTSKRLTPQFVDAIPETLELGILYVSMTYATAIHQCACGCGKEVVTPFSPTDWKLHYDGENVSLEPSIGNWEFPCRSHYWIRGGAIRWAGDMSQNAIDRGRHTDKRQKAAHYQAPWPSEDISPAEHNVQEPVRISSPRPALAGRLSGWWRKWRQ